jgi:hypothetical protein
MALLARKPSVLSQQCVTRLPMIECLSVRLPMNDVERLTCMFSVAAGAVLSTLGNISHPRVEPRVLSQTGQDFCVTVQALEGGFPSSNRVACAALGNSMVGTVGSR